MSDSAVANAEPSVLWIDQTNPDRIRRAPMEGDVEVDVALIGGGFSSLWTAYYLTKIDPNLRVAIVEKHYCGFGASGRNGGWAIGELAGPFGKYAKRSSHAGAMALNRHMFDSVDEIGRVASAEGIDCGFAKGGTIRVARNAPQATRQAEQVAHSRSEGLTDDDIRLLSADEALAICNATEVRSGIFQPHSAVLHPAKLVGGLASTVESAGVSIFEQTAVTGYEQGNVYTDRGTISARHVVRGTEAYTRDLPGQRRKNLPIYSYMIATAPLPQSTWDHIGLANRPSFADDRYMVIYGQRTADDRLAFGGTGIPYLFASGISEQVEFDRTTHAAIHDILVDFFPVVAEADITHRWGGVLAIPRNWVPGLDYNPVTGIGQFGGYVGEGVAAANLAGRTMAELIHGEPTERTTLPWVGAIARSWEPEPFRYLGVRSSRAILAKADNAEFASDRPSRAAFKISRIVRGAG